MLNSKIGKQVEFEDEVVLDQNGNRRARDSEGMSLLFCVYFTDSVLRIVPRPLAFWDS